MVGIDQEGYHRLINDATKYLDVLVHELSQSYDELYSQDVEIQDLANALDSIMYANERLKEQKVKLEAYRKKLLKEITSAYGEELDGEKK